MADCIAQAVTRSFKWPRETWEVFQTVMEQIRTSTHGKLPTPNDTQIPRPLEG